MKSYRPKYFLLMVGSSASPASFVRSSSCLTDVPVTRLPAPDGPLALLPPVNSVLQAQVLPGCTQVAGGDLPKRTAAGRSLCHFWSARERNRPILHGHLWNLLQVSKCSDSEVARPELKEHKSEEAVILSMQQRISSYTDFAPWCKLSICPFSPKLFLNSGENLHVDSVPNVLLF